MELAIGSIITVKISTLYHVLLKSFITKVPKYQRIIFVCVAMYVFLSDESLFT